MADDKDEPKDIPLRVSSTLYNYLSYLAKHTVLGHKETDVARYLLTERLKEMVRTKEHEKLKPPKDQPNAPPSEGKAPG